MVLFILVVKRQFGAKTCLWEHALKQTQSVNKLFSVKKIYDMAGTCNFRYVRGTFRWFQIVSGWFQVFSGYFSWFQVVLRFSKCVKTLTLTITFACLLPNKRSTYSL